MRGQSAVLGLVLLIGIVAVSSVGILLVAGETIDRIEQESEHERVEQSLVDMSSEFETASTASDARRSLTVDIGESGAIRKQNVGWINITTSNESFERNVSIGAIEYEGDDETVIAYQAGGVWRGTGNETRMISAPPINYDSETAVLNFPIHSLTGDEEIYSGDVTIDHNGTDSSGTANLVSGEIVRMEIQSDYYEGWREYFVTQTGDNAAVTDVDHENRTIVVELGRTDLEGAFENGITVSGNITGNKKAYDDEDVVQGESMPELDHMIEDIVDQTNTSENRVGTIDGSNDTYTNGTYFADEIDLSSDVTFDLSDGNATLVVDGDISIADGDFVVDGGENHALKVYTTGNLTQGKAEMCVAPCNPHSDVDAKRLQLYGTSEMTARFETGSGTYFEGTFYAPSEDPNQLDCQGSNDAQVCVESNTDIDGSFVVGSMDFQAASEDFDYDSQLEDWEDNTTPEGYVHPPDLTYLNVVIYELDVEND